MECISTPLVQESAGKRQVPAWRPSCPFCNGVLFEARGTSRCSRCGYTFCAGCEVPAAEQTANDG